MMILISSQLRSPQNVIDYLLARRVASCIFYLRIQPEGNILRKPSITHKKVLSVLVCNHTRSYKYFTSNSYH
jgi:hypothetical protein